MEYYRALVAESENSAAQDIISRLNAYDDMLFITGELGGFSNPQISCLCPNGETEVLGSLSDDDVSEIQRRFGENVSMYIEDFGTYKRPDGSCKLWVELDIKRNSDKGKNSLPLLIGVSAFTGALTVAVIVIRLIIKLRKKNL